MPFSNFVNKINPRPDALKHRSENGIYTSAEFCRILERECARADRAGPHFSLIDFNLEYSKNNGASSGHLIKLLSERMRSSDELGWIGKQHIGLMLYNTDAGAACRWANNIRQAISPRLYPLDFSVYVYPAEDNDSDPSNVIKRKHRIKDTVNPAINQPKSSPEFVNMAVRNSDMPNWQGFLIPLNKNLNTVQNFKSLFLRGMPLWKRSMDILGALLGLILLSPVFLLVSALIKIMSPGPVFFRQERVGYGGKRFNFWKFRTMKVNADTSAHQQYFAGLINGGKDGEGASDQAMAKLDADNPQIIPFGRILRKSCLDELPQLINVLCGDMSLVGPRPPIPYEVEEYLRWHKGRFDTVPGMTGLWQVSGKNRLTFKEMVRLDIRYSKNLSFLSDLKILMMTPIAIFSEIKYSY
jgi:lipopolysaccharide/colanic/teichoic acid biosynthesis glycosyltransferase